MEKFFEEIKNLIPNDYDEFLKCYNEEPYKGLRVNTLKCTGEKLLSLLDFPLKKTPFCDNGYYYPNEEKGLGKNPLHHAGAFYIQEPSATSAVPMLGVEEGDFVLDMCSAPGGKSTQIASLLNGKGLLVCNEIIKSRANILLSNIERMGVKNAIVTSNHPTVIAEKLPNFFDKILVDAPCSGEGMFRKDNEAQQEWSYEHTVTCSVRQLEILNNDGGEGHFCCRLRKTSSNDGYTEPYKYTKPKDEKKYLEFYDSIFNNRPFGNNLEVIKDKIYLLPNNMPNIKGLNVLRAGILLGEIKKNRIEPCHSAFMASKTEDCKSYVDLDINSEEIKKFLHGEEIPVPKETKGYTAVAVNGIVTGFGKASNGTLKNKYPKGLRNL